MLDINHPRTNAKELKMSDMYLPFFFAIFRQQLVSIFNTQFCYGAHFFFCIETLYIDIRLWKNNMISHNWAKTITRSLLMELKQ